MTLHIAVTKRNYYYTTRASVYISSLRYFSMTTYHGKSKITVCRHILSWPAYFISWPAYFYVPASIFYILASMFYNPASIFYILANIFYISGLRYISLLAHQVIKWYLESQVYQYANISGQGPNFSMPAYHGINLNPPITVYFGSPAYQGIYQ
jgi:hypothetical protein